MLLHFFPLETAWFGLRDMTVYFIFVLLGLVLAKPLAVWDGKKISPVPGLICLAGGTALFLLKPEGKVTGFVSCLLLMGAALFASLLLAGKRAAWIDRIAYLGKRAFTVYIYSWPIQAMLELVVVVVCKAPWPCCFAVLFLGGLCGPVLIYELYLRFFPRCKFLDSMIGVK